MSALTITEGRDLGFRIGRRISLRKAVVAKLAVIHVRFERRTMGTNCCSDFPACRFGNSAHCRLLRLRSLRFRYIPGSSREMGDRSCCDPSSSG